MANRTNKKIDRELDKMYVVLNDLERSVRAGCIEHDCCRKALAATVESRDAVRKAYDAKHVERFGVAS